MYGVLLNFRFLSALGLPIYEKSDYNVMNCHYNLMVKIFRCQIFYSFLTMLSLWSKFDVLFLVPTMFCTKGILPKFLEIAKNFFLNLQQYLTKN